MYYHVLCHTLCPITKKDLKGRLGIYCPENHRVSVADTLWLGPWSNPKSPEVQLMLGIGQNLLVIFPHEWMNIQTSIATSWIFILRPGFHGSLARQRSVGVFQVGFISFSWCRWFGNDSPRTSPAISGMQGWYLAWLQDRFLSSVACKDEVSGSWRADGEAVGLSFFLPSEAMSSEKVNIFCIFLMGHGKGVGITFFSDWTKKCLTEVRKTMLVLSKRNILGFP